MLKKIIFALAALFAAISFAFADVDVNKADQAALDGVKGIGPAKSKAILAERAKGGNFKDWADFESRIKGIGEKNALKLSDAGLTVNGQAKVSAKKEDVSDKQMPAAKAKATK
ncbi:helix-hairpin-helix domain-containing protein [Undibacterium amnicola]|uniref:Helix-hairpin-helix domain-containing protein n=1 Tax=Undibacterium amnicola TaxID=1834038 RepID=A0ABR6XN71_9BURK|nr:helix-hairpin-helix domain-containing protein [Undibacterium amnicola]MBC3830929.1 helix-hairpin-helix domain-containing protein [Undibacterium amnicola]